MCFSLFSVCLLVGGLSAPSSLVFSLFLVKGLKKGTLLKVSEHLRHYFFEYACTLQFSRRIEFGSTCILSLFQTTMSNFIPLYITGVNKGQFNRNVKFISICRVPKFDGNSKVRRSRRSPMVCAQVRCVHAKVRWLTPFAKAR